MHKGNLAAHTKGCVIVGLKWGRLAGKRAVLNSATAMQKLREVTGRESFTLNIYGDQHA